MKKLFAPARVSGPVSFGLLVLRALTGVAFVIHGWPKIQDPFGWGAELPLDVPDVMFALAAVAEVGGGALLVIGALTRLAAFGIVCTMAFAIYFHAVVKQPPDPFIARGSSWELPAVYAAIGLLLMIAGAGRLSADAKLFSGED